MINTNCQQAPRRELLVALGRAAAGAGGNEEGRQGAPARAAAAAKKNDFKLGKL